VETEQDNPVEGVAPEIQSAKREITCWVCRRLYSGDPLNLYQPYGSDPPSWLTVRVWYDPARLEVRYYCPECRYLAPRRTEEIEQVTNIVAPGDTGLGGPELLYRRDIAEVVILDDTEFSRLYELLGRSYINKVVVPRSALRDFLGREPTEQDLEWLKAHAREYQCGGNPDLWVDIAKDTGHYFFYWLEEVYGPYETEAFQSSLP